MFDIFSYLLFFAGMIGAALIVFLIFSRLPMGPVIYLNQSNGRSFSLPLYPTIAFAVLLIAILYFFLR